MESLRGERRREGFGEELGEAHCGPKLDEGLLGQQKSIFRTTRKAQLHLTLYSCISSCLSRRDKDGEQAFACFRESVGF